MNGLRAVINASSSARALMGCWTTVWDPLAKAGQDKFISTEVFCHKESASHNKDIMA